MIYNHKLHPALHPQGCLATQPTVRQLSIGIPAERLLDSMGKQRRDEKEPNQRQRGDPVILPEQEIIRWQFVTHFEAFCVGVLLTHT